MENLKKFEDLEEIKSIDLQKILIDEQRPFPKDLENKVFQKLKLDWNYNSNAIEGNQLSFGETVAFLNFGLTAKGKPFKDHLDIKGHNEAIQFMLQLIKENRPFSESDIKNLHKVILVEPYYTKTISQEGLEFGKEIKIGQYKTSPNHVKTISGDIHYYTDPENVPYEMNQLLEWYREAEKENLNPVVLSAIFHHKFTAIHPFDDGNGRLARILSNFILLKHNYPVIVIKNNEKTQYYASLNIADNGIYNDLIILFAENISNSFSIYQKALEGEDINEPDDLDKEIDLFTKEMQVQDIKIIDFENDRDFLINTYIKGCLEHLLPKLKKIAILYNEIKIRVYDDSEYDNFEDFTASLQAFSKISNSKQFVVKFLFNNLISNNNAKIEILVNLTFNQKSIDIKSFVNNNFDFNQTILYSQSTQNVFNQLINFIVTNLINETKTESQK